YVADTSDAGTDPEGGEGIEDPPGTTPPGTTPPGTTPPGTTPLPGTTLPTPGSPGGGSCPACSGDTCVANGCTGSTPATCETPFVVTGPKTFTVTLCPGGSTTTVPDSQFCDPVTAPAAVFS